MPIHRIWVQMESGIPNMEQYLRAVKEYLNHHKAVEQPAPKIKPPILVYDIDGSLIEQLVEVGKKRGRFTVTDYGAIAG